MRVGRSGIAVAVTLAGCSLITPLDFVGGTAGTSGAGGTGSGAGGRAGGRGGDAGSAGTHAEGGTGDGAMGGGGNGVGGGRGGTTGSGGASGEGGEAGDAGHGGDGDGGTTTAGAGGKGGGGTGGDGGGGAGTTGGGTGGDTAGTSGGGGCAGANVESDPMHCGSCGIVCGATESCIDGLCVDSPCDGLCATWVTVPLLGDGYRADNIGTAEQCYEVIGYERTMMAPAFVCWNFAPERALEINGVTAACMTEPGVALPAERLGGYCVKAGAGNHSYAGFKFPLP